MRVPFGVGLKGNAPQTLRWRCRRGFEGPRDRTPTLSALGWAGRPPGKVQNNNGTPGETVRIPEKGAPVPNATNRIEPNVFGKSFRASCAARKSGACQLKRARFRMPSGTPDFP